MLQAEEAQRKLRRQNGEDTGKHTFLSHSHLLVKGKQHLSETDPFRSLEQIIVVIKLPLVY